MRTLTTFLTCVLIAGAGLSGALAAAPLSDYTEMPEAWTCGGGGPEPATCAPSDRPEVGEHTVVLNGFGGEHFLAFPKFRNAGWDLSKSDAIEVRIKTQPGTSWRAANPVLYLRNLDGCIRIRPTDRRSLLDGKTGEWITVKFPLHDTEGWEFFTWMDGSLSNVDWIELAFFGSADQRGAADWVIVDGVRILPEQLPYTPPDENLPDLDVLWIERDPKYERYDVADYRPSTIDPEVSLGFCVNKDRKHYPDVGETITWTAHVENKAYQPIGEYDAGEGHPKLGGRYEWVLDGKVVASGTIPDLKRRQRYDVQWKWAWDPADHDLTFRVVPNGRELCARNDALTIRTNALILKHMIERGAVAQMELKYNMFGSRSAEDYLQGQIRYMNQLMARSKYPFAPDGITQRVMIGIVEYVDDYDCVDLGWGPYRVGELDLLCDGARGVSALPDPWRSGAAMWEFHALAGRPDGCWLHELSHQIGVIDDYQLITEPDDNLVNGVGFNYDYDYRGLMGGGDIRPYHNPDDLYSYYSPSDVQGLNATKGKRRGYFGEYLYQIPKDNTLIVLDEKGAPIADASIKLYQTGWITTKDGEKRGRTIDTIPELEGKTDGEGYFPLKNRPADHHVTETGCEQHDNPFGPIHVVGFNSVMLIIVEKGGVQRYGFITVPDLNFAHAAGNTEYAEYPVTVKVKGDEREYFAPPCPDRFYGNKTGLYADRKSE
jgi:hypothetical protein